MKTRIVRWGNSLGLRIPRAFAEEARVEAGSAVDLSVRGGHLVVRPVRPPEYDLGSLLQAITPDNIHEAVDTGERVGREAW